MKRPVRFSAPSTKELAPAAKLGPPQPNRQERVYETAERDSWCPGAGCCNADRTGPAGKHRCWCRWSFDVSNSRADARAVPLVQTVQIVRQVEVAPAFNVFELDGGTGVVVFRQVNGKLVSRFYRAQA